MSLRAHRVSDAPASSRVLRVRSMALVVTLASVLAVAGGVGTAEAQAADAPPRENLLEFGAQAGLLFRQFRYNDDAFGFLRDYQLRNAAVLGGYLVAYPLAIEMADNPLGRLGVELRYNQMQLVNSLRADGARFPTRSNEVILGLRYRLLGSTLRRRGFDVNAGVGFAQHMFRVRSAVAAPNVDNRAALPSVRYRAIRLDVHGRVPLDAGFFITGHFGLRIVVDAGDIDDSWFPNARRAGIEAGVHLGYVLPKNIELLAGFESRRYFYDMRAEPGDAFVVGGLLDRHVLADVRIGWRY